jgi:hypothetical protein
LIVFGLSRQIGCCRFMVLFVFGLVDRECKKLAVNDEAKAAVAQRLGMSA